MEAHLRFDPRYRKKEFEKQTYPAQTRKPREICPDCGEEIYLKWGEIITDPYWSHNKSVCDCPFGLTTGESEEHKKAKTKLANLLESSRLYVLTECTVCKARVTEKMPGGLIYTQEVPLEDKETGTKCKFDVAGVTRERLEIGFEVMATHETDNVIPRSQVWWCELSAEDILTDDSSQVSIPNIRKKQVCLGNKECVKKLRDDILEFEKRRNERLKLAEEYGFMHNGAFTDFGILSDVIKSYEWCLLCGEEKKSNIFAFCWNCRWKTVSRDEHFVKELASKSGFPNWNCWTFLDNIDRESAEWKRISKSGKCIKCHNRHSKYEKFPFCQRCTSDIIEKNKNNTRVQVRATSEEENNKRPAQEIPEVTPAPKKTKESIPNRPPNKVIAEPEPLNPGDPYGYFVGNKDYGPASGITQIHRYKRAKVLGCYLPQSVIDYFETQISQGKT